MTVNRQRLAGLRAELDAAISTRLAGATEVALLDMPYHDNVGDSLIWAGEVAALKRLGVKVSYTSDISHFDPDVVEGLSAECVLLCHGGGNFGDTWPWSEAFRNDLAKRFPGRRIVVLPQSIQYAEPANRDTTAEVLGRHVRLEVMARDDHSLRTGREMGLNVFLSPDAAFGFDAEDWGVERFRKPTVPIVALWRADKESSSSGHTTAPIDDHVVVDWLGGRDRLRERSWRPLWKVTRLQRSTRLASAPISRFFNAMAERELRRGFAMLGQAEVVVTDRLHATVMAVMLGLPVIWVDNSYGKLSKVLGRWLEGADGLQQAEDRAHALQLARSLG